MCHSPSETEVLIVEDEAELRTMYADWLSDSYHVRVARDGRTALETCHDALDIILLDRKLPDRNGEELISQFKDHSPNCQIAMVTSVEPEWDTLGMDIDAYVTKPVRYEDLVVLVDGLSQRDYQKLAEYDDIIL